MNRAALNKERLARAKPASVRDVALLNFTQFAIKQNIQFRLVRPDVGPDGMRGLYCTFPVQARDTLISVPRTAALVVTPAERSPLPQLPDSTWAGLPWYCQLSIKLALMAAAGNASPMQDFMRALPQQPVDLPALWPADDIAQLQYPFLESKVLAEQRHWRELYASCSAGLAAGGVSREAFEWALSITRSRSFAGPHFRSPFKVKVALFGVLQVLAAAFAATHLPVEAGELPWTAFLAEAAAVALPSAWAVSDVKAAQQEVEYVVCPFIDFLNHSSQCQAECQFDWLRDSYRVVSDCTYKPGDQVYINYGAQSNDQLLQLYGFVEQGNKDDRYTMTRLEQWLLKGPLAELTGGAQLLEPKLRALQSTLGEVVITGSGGFDPNVHACISALVQQALVGKQGQDVPSAAAIAILVDACERELAASGCTYEADQQQLRDLIAAVARAKEPPSAAPPPVPELLMSEAQGQPCEAAAGPAAQPVLTNLGEGPGSSEQETTELTPEQTPGTGHLEPRLRPMDAVEAKQLLLDFPRKYTQLLFRMEKKALLVGCMERLRSGR